MAIERWNISIIRELAPLTTESSINIQHNLSFWVISGYLPKIHYNHYGVRLWNRIAWGYLKFDLKPNNILIYADKLTNEQLIKLIDFKYLNTIQQQ